MVHIRSACVWVLDNVSGWCEVRCCCLVTATIPWGLWDEALEGLEGLGAGLSDL